MNNIGLERISKAILKMIKTHYKEPEKSKEIENSFYNSFRRQIRQ